MGGKRSEGGEEKRREEEKRSLSLSPLLKIFLSFFWLCACDVMMAVRVRVEWDMEQTQRDVLELKRFNFGCGQWGRVIGTSCFWDVGLTRKVFVSWAYSLASVSVFAMYLCVACRAC